MSKKPKMAMITLPSVEELAQLYFMMTGHAPTPNEIEEMRELYEKQHDEALDELLIIDGDGDGYGDA